MSETLSGDHGKPRISNPESLEKFQKKDESKIDEDDDDEKEEDPYASQLQESKYPSPEKILKMAFVPILFMVVLCSGYVARISFHILIWNTLPPIESEQNPLSTLGGLLQHNCTTCMGNAACTSHTQSTIIDGNWIWSVFLVVTTPYFMTFLSTLFRICFKTNKSLKIKTLIVVLLVETVHSIGISILALLVLPSFDPISASVVYLAVMVIPPLLDVFSNLLNRKMSRLTTVNIMLALVGLAFQIAGIISICLYIKIGWLSGLFVMAAIFVSIKYWENFITMDNTTVIGDMKRDLQKGKTKVTCLANLWKIIVTFLSVVVIFTSRSSHDSIETLNALFNNGKSSINSVFHGYRDIGRNESCETYVPFVVAVINIVCDYICYKAAKTACIIYSQKLGLSIPIIILPVLTTFSLFGILAKPDSFVYTSCDILFSDWCLQSIAGLEWRCLELVIAFMFLYISVGFITRHIWKSNGYRHGETSRIFTSPFYCGMFLDLSLLLNRRRNDLEYDVIYEKNDNETSQQNKKPFKLYACCATMWHETANEMTQLLKSLFRLDKRQKQNELIAKIDEDKIGESFELEAHIFFDDAFEPIEEGEQYPDVNEYVKEFMRVLNVAGSIVHGKTIVLAPGEMYRTPYGGRIEWKLPAGNTLIVHLKDKSKIRHKKRWSQVMYMFYVLKWKILRNNTELVDIQDAADSSYLLALDGDVDFEPEAVLSLVRRMKKSPLVGAACGRIHPIGSGPMVWYQKFEYAISHWLQKATEHVIGCVLCSPGCFSLFRGSAILDQDVLEKYTTVASEAQQYVQYDQGEDRWLCTLMLKQGWRVEYCAESDSYTFAPEGFYEFFNQRRRWTPSTLANILDLIMDWKLVTRNNQNISFLYICYHTFLFISTLLTPGTIFMIILGAIVTGFESIPPWLALVLNLIPVGIFLLMCLYASTQRQLQYAAILSSVYVIVMVIVMIGVIKDAIEEGLCSITTIFIIFVAGVFVVSAILHPKEFLCLIPGLLYFVAIPSMCMILFFYSIGNLHVVSWGTRESKQKTDTDKGKKKHVPEREEKGHFFSFGSFFRTGFKHYNCLQGLVLSLWRRHIITLISCICCPTNTYTKEDFLYKVMVDRLRDTGFNTYSEHTEEDAKGSHFVYTGTEKDRTSQQNILTESTKESQQDEIHYYFNEARPKIPKDEAKFWKKIIKKYLKPLEKDEEKEKAVQQDLLDLRNRVSLFVFLLNAVLVTVMFGLTHVNSFQHSLSVTFKCAGNDVSIVPIAILFTVVFGLLLLIQFLCMLYHRFSTFMHIMAETDIKDTEKTRTDEIEFKYAEFLTNSGTREPPKTTALSDKNKSFTDKNKSILFEQNRKTFTSLDEVVNKRMSQLQNLKGSLHLKHKDLETKVMNKWMKNAKLRKLGSETKKPFGHLGDVAVNAMHKNKSGAIPRLNHDQTDPVNDAHTQDQMENSANSGTKDRPANASNSENEDKWVWANASKSNAGTNG